MLKSGKHCFPPGAIATSLLAAAHAGSTEIVRLLLEAGPAASQTEAVHELGNNALMCATVRGHLAIVRELLLATNARQQANALNDDGMNALAIARALNFRAIAKLLEPYTEG